VTFAVFRDAPGLLAAVIVLATLGKVVGTALAYLPTGNGWREGVVLGAGMNGRGAVEIIIAGIGLQAGIIDRTTFSILVLMAIATTATVPLLLTWGVRWLTDRGELVRSTGRDGTLVVGAGPLARALARRLQERGPVVLVDRNAEHVEAARSEGMTAHLGDALDGDVLASAGIEEASTVVALTPNAEVNVLVAQRARERWLVEDLYALLPGERDGGLFTVLEGLGGRVLFARPADPAAWDARIRSGGTREVTVEVGDGPNATTDLARSLTAGAWLPLALVRGDAVRPFGDDLEEGDRVIVLEPTG